MYHKLRFAFLLLLSECQFYSNDNSSVKSTEFTYTLIDTLQFDWYSLYDIDVLSDTSFVVSCEFDDRKNKKYYNQILWEKHNGFTLVLDSILSNGFFLKSTIDYFDGNDQIHIKGSERSIIETLQGQQNHKLVQSFRAEPIPFWGVQLVDAATYYAFGSKGELVKYEQGNYRRIPLPLSLRLNQSAYKDSTLVLFSFQNPANSDLGLAVLKNDSVTFFQQWDTDALYEKSIFTYEIVIEKDSILFYAKTGLYSLKDSIFTRVTTDLILSASFLHKEDGFYEKNRQLRYKYNNEEYEQSTPAKFGCS